jgi:hypothetical protein
MADHPFMSAARQSRDLWLLFATAVSTAVGLLHSLAMVRDEFVYHLDAHSFSSNKLNKLCNRYCLRNVVGCVFFGFRCKIFARFGLKTLISSFCRPSEGA